MLGGCKKYPRGVKGGKSRYLGFEREREGYGGTDMRGEEEREREYGISGQPDIYNLYFIFSFKNVN